MAGQSWNMIIYPHTPERLYSEWQMKVNKNSPWVSHFKIIMLSGFPVRYSPAHLQNQSGWTRHGGVLLMTRTTSLHRQRQIKCYTEQWLTTIEWISSERNTKATICPPSWIYPTQLENIFSSGVLHYVHKLITNFYLNFRSSVPSLPSCSPTAFSL